MKWIDMRPRPADFACRFELLTQISQIPEWYASPTSVLRRLPSLLKAGTHCPSFGLLFFARRYLFLGLICLYFGAGDANGYLTPRGTSSQAPMTTTTTTNDVTRQHFFSLVFASSVLLFFVLPLFLPFAFLLLLAMCLYLGLRTCWQLT